MRKLLIFVCAILVQTCQVLGQVPPTVETKIDSLFSEWDSNLSPGAAIGIVKDGRLVYTKGYGMANLDYQIPLDANSKFYISSTTKQFTAACIALLSLNGQINLGDDIRSYIPEIPDYGQTIIIKNLVYHTSGLRDYLSLMSLAGKSYQNYFTINDGIKRLGKQQSLNFMPGEQFQYSNSGYILMAEIVNRVSGMTIREYAEKHIFNPLQMKDTFFNDDFSQVTKNRVISYRKNETNGYRRFIQNFDALGDGNLLTTVNDLFKWDQNFYHKKVGGARFIDLMLTPGTLNNGDTLDYAFGISHGNYKGLPNVAHSGGFLGFRSQFIRFPEQNFSIIVLANRADASPWNLALKISDLFLDAQFEQDVKKHLAQQVPEIAVSEFTLEQIAGTYQVLPGIVVELSVQNDSLQLLQKWDGSTYNIAREQGNTFAVPNLSAKFVFKELKDQSTQVIEVKQGEDLTLGKRLKQVDLSSINIAEYAGVYFSDELEVRYDLFLENDVLKLRINDHEPLDLAVSAKDILYSSGAEYRFQRSDGQITGFELDAVQMSGLKFYKTH